MRCPLSSIGQRAARFIFGGIKMKISNIKAMRNYLYENSGFSKRTGNNVIRALGYPLRGSGSVFKDLSGEFENCA
jgi:hypothetical protein